MRLHASVLSMSDIAQKDARKKRATQDLGIPRTLQEDVKNYEKLSASLKQQLA